jgi:hypothetical protein
MNLARPTLASGVALAVAACIVSGQDSSKARRRAEEKFTSTAEADWEARLAAIKKEICALGNHPWAGTYYYGDGLGVNASLTLAPKSGFVFTWEGCLGVYDRNFGDIIQTDRGSLKLGLMFENSQKGFQGVAEELVPIAWGQRHYLIRFDGVPAFCNAVNSGSEPRGDMHGFYYLRQGDHEKRVKGPPELPEQYQAYLLKEPIDAEVVAVKDTTIEEGIGGWTFHKTEVTLNVGRSTGVLPGMSFHVYEPEDILTRCGATILAVDEHSSTALIDQPSTDKVKPTSPAVGWKLTTGNRARCQKSTGGD